MSQHRVVSRVLFWLVAVLCLAPMLPLPESILALVAPGALVLGALLALTLGNPYGTASKSVSKVLLQAAVVLLGFSLDIHKVLEAGSRGIGFGLASIACVFLLGWGLQRVLKVRPLTGLLVSTGTAVCGGSAIAAMATVTDAPQEDVSVAVGTVFLLNALALMIFPPIGHALGLTGDQFGTWAGIAIHDVSSVVGAATAFGAGALTTATAVKLSRVLYLVPIVIIAAAILRRSGEKQTKSTPIPWFIGLFLLACVARSYVPAIADQALTIKHVASAGFAGALFLIGAGISRATLKAVGARPLVQGVSLWLFISVVSLLVVKTF